MAYLSSEAKTFIKNNKNLIDSGDFETFFDVCYDYWSRKWDLDQYTATLNFLYDDCGIDFFRYIETLPPLRNFTADTLIIPENITRVSVSFNVDGFSKVNVKKLIFSANVRSLQPKMFAGLGDIRSIEINSPNLTRLPDKAFESSPSLEKIFLNSPIKVIGSGAIYNCPYLKTIVCNKNIQLRVPADEIVLYRTLLRSRKATIQESLSLTEAYSPSMPQWLRRWLDAPQCKKYKQRLIERGLDLSKAKFISVAPSALKKSQENRVKEPNIAFWDLSIVSTTPKTDVCAKGINDDDCGLWSINDHYFKYWPLKLLVANASNFCYVDTSDPENLYDREERIRSKNSRGDLIANGVERIQRNTMGVDQLNRILSGKIDKSGYVIVGAANKFKDALMKAKAKNYQRFLDDAKRDLLNYKDYITSELNELLSEEDPNSISISSELSLLQEAVAEFKNLVSSFEKCSASVSSIANRFQDDELTRQIIKYFDEGGSWTAWGSFKRDLKNFKRRYIKQLVNWEIPEYEGD